MSGRTSLYSKELADAICERLAAGESLVSICKDEAMPGLRTVMQWAAERDEFRIEYARAREAQAEFMDHQILEAANSASADPNAAKVKIGAFQWRAAKLAPKRYGDRQVIATDPEAPVVADGTRLAERLASILAAARARRDAGVKPDPNDLPYSHPTLELAARHIPDPKNVLGDDLA